MRIICINFRCMQLAMTMKLFYEDFICTEMIFLNTISIVERPAENRMNFAHGGRR